MKTRQQLVSELITLINIKHAHNEWLDVKHFIECLTPMQASAVCVDAVFIMTWIQNRAEKAHVFQGKLDEWASLELLSTRAK